MVTTVLCIRVSLWRVSEGGEGKSWVSLETKMLMLMLSLLLLLLAATAEVGCELRKGSRLVYKTQTKPRREGSGCLSPGLQPGRVRAR